MTGAWYSDTGSSFTLFLQLAELTMTLNRPALRFQQFGGRSAGDGSYIAVPVTLEIKRQELPVLVGANICQLKDQSSQRVDVAREDAAFFGALYEALDVKDLFVPVGTKRITGVFVYRTTATFTNVTLDCSGYAGPAVTYPEEQIFVWRPPSQ